MYLGIGIDFDCKKKEIKIDFDWNRNSIDCKKKENGIDFV